MRYLSIDVETFSSEDIGNGAYAYSDAPDFEVMLIGYMFDDETQPTVIDLMDPNRTEMYPEFFDALEDKNVIKTAFNANFEITTLQKLLPNSTLDPAQWRCTMILAAQLGLPMSLAAVCEALELPADEQKDKIGKALIQYFCKPCKPTKSNGGRTRNYPEHAPEKWKLFKGYNAQDVIAEHGIWKRLVKFAPNAAEQNLWTLDQLINSRGVRIDRDLAEKIVGHDTVTRERLAAEAKRISHLENPNSLDQLKGWLRSKGITADALTKDSVAGLLKGSIPEDARRVLEIRQLLGKTSVNKYQTMLDLTKRDGRARGILQFYGGRTGRWAGRALQPQNLPQNHMPDAELDECRDLVKLEDFDTLEMLFGDTSPIFSELIRTAFIPSEGCRFVVSDFSAIEARVIAWVAGEEWRVELFRNGGDIYCESASRIYHVPVVKHGENGHLRQRGKVAELACGYGGGLGAMKAMDTSHSVPDDEMSEIIRQWRAESPNIVSFWKRVEKAAIETVETGNKRIVQSKTRDPLRARENEELMGAEEGSFSNYFVNGFTKLEFSKKQVAGFPVLFIKLPSGRSIAYWNPRVEEVEGQYGLSKRLTYMAQNQTTRKWERTETYGGKLTENIVQSIARDCLAVKMVDVTEAGYKIAFHVHDEMVVDVPKTDERAADLIDRIMGEPIEWAPDLPLKGGTYECEYYRKD